MISRRHLLGTTAAAAAASSLAHVAIADEPATRPAGVPAHPKISESPRFAPADVRLSTDALPKHEGRPLKLAVIATVWRPTSHADHIATKFIRGYTILGRPHRPPTEVVSLHLQQQPPADIGAAMASQYRIRLCPTIAEALTLGTDTLAVDGVLLIGEHGDYPYNDKGQQLYPRKEMFEEIVQVFERTGKSCPVFCDKGLSYEWAKAEWMVQQHKRLGFAMMGGSSVPLTWRRPPLKFERGIELETALAIGGFERDAYGFHCLEVLQSFVEARSAGGIGVKRVHTLAGQAAWDAAERGEWRLDLLRAALMCMDESIGARGRRAAKLSLDELRKLEPDPCVFLLTYADDFRAAVYMSPVAKITTEFGFAAKVKGLDTPAATWCHLPRLIDDHFSFLCNEIEVMFRTGKPPIPIERTLLTSGALEAVHDSLALQKPIDTPHLADIRYDPPA
jgi:hypothetical protein